MAINTSDERVAYRRILCVSVLIFMAVGIHLKNALLFPV